MRSELQKQTPFFLALDQRVRNCGISKRELATRMPVDPLTLSELLASRYYPDAESSLSLAAALGCTLESLSYDLELADTLTLESKGEAIKWINRLLDKTPDPALQKTVHELSQQMEPAAEREAARLIDRIRQAR